MVDVELSALSVDYYATDVEVRRKTRGAAVRGEWVAVDLPPFTIKANVQPLSGFDLRQVPEHERAEHTVRVTTREVLNMAGVDGAEYSDLIQHEGKLYKITSKSPRSKGHYCKYFAGVVR